MASNGKTTLPVLEPTDQARHQENIMYFLCDTCKKYTALPIQHACQRVIMNQIKHLGLTSGLPEMQQIEE